MVGSSGSASDPAPAARSCPKCGREIALPIACGNCGHLQTLPASINHFTLLGLVPAIDVDLEKLERAYLRSSRLVHPDFFASRPKEEQTQALRLSAAVNEAYRTVKTPVLRSEYVLLLAGGKNAGMDRHTPPGFLAEMLALREELEEGQVSPERARSLNDDVDIRMAKHLADVAKLFRELSAEPALKIKQLVEMRGLLNSYYYLETLKENLPAGGRKLASTPE